ncbi:MAG: hypothetical protein HY820_43310 [Acidobacteria bacterium]|nr:hypothetical protein [Acidobacteriota bacterium]
MNKSLVLLIAGVIAVGGVLLYQQSRKTRPPASSAKRNAHDEPILVENRDLALYFGLTNKHKVKQEADIDNKKDNAYRYSTGYKALALSKNGSPLTGDIDIESKEFDILIYYEKKGMEKKLNVKQKTMTKDYNTIFKFGNKEEMICYALTNGCAPAESHYKIVGVKIQNVNDPYCFYGDPVSQKCPKPDGTEPKISILIKMKCEPNQTEEFCLP